MKDVTAAAKDAESAQIVDKEPQEAVSETVADIDGGTVKNTNTAPKKAVSGIITEDPASVMPTPGNISVNFKDVDIHTVLNYLSEISSVDIIPSPEVKGMVTMRLRNKPWEVALDIITRTYGYAYSKENDIIRVMPRDKLQTEDVITEVISLQNMVENVELRKGGGASSGGDSGSSGGGGGGGGGKEGVAVSKEKKGIEELMKAIDSMLSKARGETATFVSNTNSIVITAIPSKIKSIKAMVAKLDKKPPQILLEAQVIEILLSNTEKMGIDWNTVITASGAKRPTTFPFQNDGILKMLPGYQREYYPSSNGVDGRTDFPLMDISSAKVNPITVTPSDTALFTYGTLDFTQFQAVLSMLDQRSNTNILSKPRITTLNNQKATIKVVQKVMLQKTQSAVQTANVVTVEFEKDEEAREVGVILTVIPHVNDSGEIVVNVVPEVSSDVTFSQLAVGANQNTVAMTYDTRESNTQVRVNSGETIFIGGLIKDSTIKTHNKFPVLGDIFQSVPGVNKLFNSEGTTKTKSE
ncbi:MAG: secretin and TonB N-terminal domain-containing protein, partial [Candidatus Omnitrophica bacterium]|nr:secretin and TonB N-terminal domain-containing protein [Candidatus Omnitrophota bacterium]